LLEGPLNPIPIGPVTSRMMILEKLKFSMLALPALILIGQPYVSYIKQLVTAMFCDSPPPKRKMDHLVLKLQLVTVTNLLLPNKAQASSWHCTSQFITCTYSQSLKWKPSL